MTTNPKLIKLSESSDTAAILCGRSFRKGSHESLMQLGQECEIESIGINPKPSTRGFSIVDPGPMSCDLRG